MMKDHQQQLPNETTAQPTLYQRAIELVRIIQDGPRMQREIAGARETLTKSADMRACLMGLPPGTTAPALQTVLQFHDQFNGPSKRSSASRNKSRKETRIKRQEIASSILTDPAIVEYTSKQFPEVTVEELLQKPAFMVELIGPATLDGESEIRMETIFARLKKVEQAIHDGMDLRGLKALGRAWIPTDKMTVLMEVEAQWQSYFLSNLIHAGYLDEIAGITYPGSVKRKDCRDIHNGKGQARMLKERGSDVPSGGIIEWSDSCFSPGFLQYLQEDVMPSINFMADPDSPHERYVRCEAPAASSRNAIYFQIGKPPRAKLFQAVESSKFGDSLLAIANYVESERRDFFYNTIKLEYGVETASNFVPPKKNYDILFALVGDSSFAYHTDSAEMLCNESRSGWEECFLRVITFFFQSQEEPDETGTVNLKFRPRRGGTGSAKEEIVVPLCGPNGMHEQANYNQSNWEHTATHESRQRFRRLVFTARATGPLQEVGLERLTAQQPNLNSKIYGECTRKYRISGDLVLHGNHQDTEEPPCPGHDNHTVMEEEEPVGLSQPIPNLTTGTINLKRKGVNSLKLQKAIRFCRVNTTSDMSPATLQVPRRLIQISDRLIEMITTVEGQEVFMKNTRRLLVQTSRGTIPFGPPLDLPNSSSRLAQVGEFFPTHVVRKYYQLPDSVSQRPPWDSSVECLSSLHLSKPYKAPLLPSSDGFGSPMGEMLRIQEGGTRAGFAIYLSGGNSTPANSQGPTVDKHVVLGAGDSTVVWKTPKRMSILANARNRSLYEVALMDRVLTVWLCGQNLPVEYQQKDGQDMSMYAGLYHIDTVELCKPWTARELKNYIDLLPADAPKVRVENLSFLRCRHLKCYLLPCSDAGGDVSEDKSHPTWKDLVVKSDAMHEVCFEAGDSFKAEDLSVEDCCLPPTKELAHAFLENQGQQDEKNSSSKATRKMNPSAPPIIVCNAVQTKYCSTEVMHILKRVLVSYNMRLIWLNVDNSGTKLSILKDHGGGGHGDTNMEWGSRYSNIFASKCFGFCRALGSNVTENAYPCPFPAGDAKVLHLMKCNLAGFDSFKAARDSRDGLAYIARQRDQVGWYFVQSFITETTGNPTTNLLWWEDYCSEMGDSLDCCGSPCLPHSHGMLRHYISFLRASTEDDGGQLTKFWQTHYQQDRTIMNVEFFAAALTRVAEGARQLVDKIVDGGNVRDNSRHRILMLLASFLATSMNGVTNAFLAGRVLANMEELVGNEPFGPVISVPFGAGGLHGAKLVDWKSLGMQEGEDVEDGDLPTTWTKVLLEAVKAQAEHDDWYGYLYIDKETGTLHQAINGRMLNAVDMEHFLCKLYIYREHEPGGGRCVTNTPRLQRTHCFPMKGFTQEIIGSKLPLKSLQRYRHEYIASGIQYMYMEEVGDALLNDPIFNLQGFRDSTPTVFTNEFVTKEPLPKHGYRKRTFVNKTSWEEQADRLMTSRPHLNIDGVEMRVLEDGPGGLNQHQVHWYDNKKLSALLHSVGQVESSYGDLGYPEVQFSDTFTLHEQTEASSQQGITAFYHHVDVPFAQGRILVYPLQGDSWMLVASSADGLALKDDSKYDFNRWKSTLEKGERENVEAFVEDFKKYALKRHRQSRLNIYRNTPGRALAIAGAVWCHAVIVPKQPKGKPRKALLFHRLELV